MIRYLLSQSIRLCAHCRTVFFAAAYRAFRPAKTVLIGAGCRLRATDGGSIELGERTMVDFGCTLIARGGQLKVGPDAFIGQGSVLVSVEQIIIGRDILIAEHVTIRDHDHAFTVGRPYRAVGMLATRVTIGDNVWLGAKVTVTRGVTIGDNAVIGANSVVTSDIPANSVAVGSPARVIRMLGRVE